MGYVFALALLTLALLLLVGLLYARKRNATDKVILLKTALSCLFVVAALAGTHSKEAYFHLMLSGLVFALAGDICLAIPRPAAFKLGLIAFLIAHVFYIMAFALLSEPEGWILPAAVLEVLFVGGIFFTWLSPHLGGMRIPVFLYTAVAALTLAGAISVYLNTHVSGDGSKAILAGTLLFVVSDLFVARHRFVVAKFANRLYGLPLYYAGQFLLAFSVSLV